MSDLLGVLILVVVLAGVIWLLAAPLRETSARREPAAQPQPELPALEAARDAKYAEIRDNELDYRTGKLSEEDFRALDRELRAQAVEILHALDRLR